MCTVIKYLSGWHMRWFLPKLAMPERRVSDMNFAYLKKLALALVLLFILQGCALYVRDRDDYRHHYPRHDRHYHWDRR